VQAVFYGRRHHADTAESVASVDDGLAWGFAGRLRTPTPTSLAAPGRVTELQTRHTSCRVQPGP